jgi:hypothetical protein
MSLWRIYQRELREPGAFLPERVPSLDLGSAFEPYLDACRELPERYDVGVRAWLDDRFAVLGTDLLDRIDEMDEASCETLASMFAVLGHAYRWDRMPPAEERFAETTLQLPAGLHHPWQAVSRRVGHPMVGSAYSLHYANWCSRSLAGGSAFDPGCLARDDLEMAFPWLGGSRASALRSLSLAFVLMEARGALVLRHLVAAIDAAERHDVTETSHALVDLAPAVGELAAAFVVAIRPSLVDPTDFLEWIQPSSGWAVDTGDGECHLGASGLQVGALQSLDIALGVTGTSEIARGYPNARRYLPRRFQNFLAALDERAHVLPTFVESASTATVRRAYATCLGEMQRFRRAHRVRGAQYLQAGSAIAAPRRSSGLSSSYHDAEGPIARFEASMQARIDETEGAKPHLDAGDETTAEATFRFLTEVERAKVLECGHDVAVAEGEHVVRAGQRQDALYALVDGLLRVVDRDDLPVARVWPGEVFGEMGFVTAESASADVVAEIDSTIRVIPHDELFALLRADAPLGTRFYQSLAALLARRLATTTSLLHERGEP